MSYYTQTEIEKMGFKYIGENVKISTKASIYEPEKIEIGDNSRVDDFCVISGIVKIGKYVHIAPFCLVAGGDEGITFEDFSVLSYKVQIFTRSDDYSGETLTNSTISEKYKNVLKEKVFIGKHSIVGAGSIIMPGVKLGEGTSIGAMSLVRKNTVPWSIYVGSPAKKLKDRKKDLLLLEKQFLEENGKK